jgi:hypothetical protein
VQARAAASIPSDPGVSDQTVLIVNTPTYFLSSFSFLIHALNNKPCPARTFVLGSGVHPVQIDRPDERTLIVSPAAGYLAAPGSPEPGREADQPLFDPRHAMPLLDRLYRDSRPMKIGQRIELADLDIEIISVTEDGRPAAAAFHFLKALKDPSLRWLQWEDGEYKPFVPPAVGDTITRPAVTIPY